MSLERSVFEQLVVPPKYHEEVIPGNSGFLRWAILGSKRLVGWRRVLRGLFAALRCAQVSWGLLGMEP
jgi:hypothetical protein